MGVKSLKEYDTTDLFDEIGYEVDDDFHETYDDSFKKTLTEQERFRYEVLVFMKKNGYKLINSKCFKKKDVYIPVALVEEFYQKNDEIDLDEIIEHQKIVKSM